MDMEHTKGKIEVWSHIGRGWAVQVMCCKDGKDALSGRDFEEAQANADELVRRWNAFEGLLAACKAVKNIKNKIYGFDVGGVIKQVEAAIAKVS